MKVLWLSHIFPFPPRGGNLQRSFNLIREISESCTVSLIAFNARGDSATRLHEYTSELKKYCEKVETWELPYPSRSLRWWTGLALSPLFQAPFTCRMLWSEKLVVKWRRVLEKHPGALLHFDSLDLALFAEGLGDFRKVLNHHNCESAMADRRARMEPSPVKRAYLRLHASKLAKLESRLCHQFEVNTVVSELDARTLRDRNPKAHTHIVENGTDTRYFVPSAVPEEPKSLIFAGSLNWYPNLSAIRFFTRDVWPLVKQQCPDVRLYLAGQNPPSWLVRQTAEDPRIRLVPNPEDIRPWVARASAFICPILDGGGTRLKILDAMAMGKPVVSTSIGCEGLQVKHGENILIADSPESFATEACRLLENDLLRHQIATAGRNLVADQYSWERIAHQLEMAYRCAQQGGACGQTAGEAARSHLEDPA